MAVAAAAAFGLVLLADVELLLRLEPLARALGPRGADALAAAGVVALAGTAVLALRGRRDARTLDRRYRSLFRANPVGVVVSSFDGRVLEVNEVWEETFGYDRADAVGSHVADLEVWADPTDREAVLDRLAEQGSVERFVTAHRTRSGERREVELWVESLGTDGGERLSWAIRDVTERNEYRRQLERQALHDTLTGLPNRNLLLDRLRHATERARRHGETLALLFVDLDGFKSVNDRFGHGAGDQVLREAARRMKSALRGEDTLARLSGDEFVVLLEETDEVEAREVADRLLAGLTTGFEVQEREVGLGASVGIAVRGTAGRELLRGTEMLEAADAAMYEAKREGGSRLHVFSPDEAGPGDRIGREERLRAAIEGGELVVYYQPIVDLQAGTVAGCEAFVRWDHPEHGLLPPGEFLPLAEDTGLVRPLDDRVASTAIRQASAWLEDPSATRARPDEFRLGLNAAAHRYDEDELAERLLDRLGEAGLSASVLQLEVAERLALADTRPFLDLRRKGVRVAIDDFGRGYSSLTYLRHLEADVLKIDRFFVEELERERSTSIIVRSVLSIAAHLEVDVIAEGVETEAQRDHLRDLGCRLAQGYFFARPMPADDFGALLRSERPVATG